ncbi:SCO2521 family protein [Kitasatospora acidiphila]|uniref:SCO2521 family protein n=1 Tax=Kitasatospora acidiphila TaxID=2567942 RepID=UPI0015F0AF53|nr:SCO2521 family protein [Kitasatospora acidiphila]
MLLGEVRTSLLQHSVELSRPAARDLLQLRHGERVVSSTRPNQQVRSAGLLTGVDCKLPTGSRRTVRGVGTVLAQAVLTEGRLLQSSARVRIGERGTGQRRPWGHYLARPGTIEPTGPVADEDLMDGFLGAPSPGWLDLSAIADRLLADVQTRGRLDGRAPLESSRTRLLWTAALGPPAAHFTIENDTLRTLRLTLERVDPVAVAAFCEDLALHDWLLTTLLQLIERSGLGSASGAEPTRVLRPAVNHLLHLWMPGARLTGVLAQAWESLETSPGLTRQWAAAVQRVRDHLASQVSHATELFDRLQKTPLANGVMTQLVNNITELGDHQPAIVGAFTRRELRRLSDLLKELKAGQAAYDGEDQDWLLTLTHSAATAIDAISTAVDIGFWSTELGRRYLDAQRAAVRRGVPVRRIFVLQSSDQRAAERIRRVGCTHRDLGLNVRMVAVRDLPAWVRRPMSDFIVFDHAISYEVQTDQSGSDDSAGPDLMVASTLLVLSEDKVARRRQRFEDLWVIAGPLDGEQPVNGDAPPDGGDTPSGAEPTP